jgi:hypothetical protein
MQLEKQTTGSPQLRQFTRGQTTREKADWILRIEDVYGKERAQEFIDELEDNELMTPGIYNDIDDLRSLRKND